MVRSSPSDYPTRVVLSSCEDLSFSRRLNLYILKTRKDLAMPKHIVRLLFYLEQGFVLSGAFHAMFIAVLNYYPSLRIYLIFAALFLILAFVSIRFNEDVPLEERTTSTYFPLEAIAFCGIALVIPMWVGFIVSILWTYIVHEPVIIAAILDAGSIPVIVGIFLLIQRVRRRRQPLADT